MIEALRTFWYLTRPLAALPFAFAFLVGALFSGAFINPGQLLGYAIIVRYY